MKNETDKIDKTPPREEVTQWLKQLGDGESDVCRLFWEEYFGKLTRLARRKLGDFPRRDLDEEDIALSAMNSFFQGMREKKFDSLHDRSDLWKLLVTITARKTTAKKRHRYAKKRGEGRIRGESIFVKAGSDEQDFGIGEILGNEPTPQLAVSLAENCRILLEKLDDETLRQIAIMKLEGNSTEEIASELGCVRRTVERKLQRIRNIWSVDWED